MAIELAMWLPVLFLLISGIVQFGKITYIYYSLQKTMTTVAGLLAVQNGVNFCPDAGDPPSLLPYNSRSMGPRMAAALYRRSPRHDFGDHAVPSTR
jgi:hypothetical protein